MINYLKVGVILAVIAGLAYSHYWMYDAGQEAQRMENLKAVAAHRDRENQLIAELEDERKKREARVEVRTQFIRDNSGPCGKQPVPDAIKRMLIDGGG